MFYESHRQIYSACRTIKLYLLSYSIKTNQNTLIYRVAQKKRGQWAILSNCKYSENSMTEFRENW